jgi:ribosomal protein S13
VESLKKCRSIINITLCKYKEEIIMDDNKRKELLEKAQKIRQDQAKVRGQLQEGELDATAVLIQRGKNPIMGRMRLGYLLMSIKGIGKFKANKMVEKWGLAIDTRLEAITLEQVITIAEELNAVSSEPAKDKPKQVGEAVKEEKVEAAKAMSAEEAKEFKDHPIRVDVSKHANVKIPNASRTPADVANGTRQSGSGSNNG